MIPRRNTANHPWQGTGGLVADESIQIDVSDQFYGYVAPTSPASLLRAATGSSNADSDSLPQELQRVQVKLNAAASANDAYWRQQGWHALNARNGQQTGCMNAARQYEQAAHDRAVAGAKAPAQKTDGHVHEVLKHSNESADGDSQSEKLGGRKCHTRAETSVDV